MTNWKCGDGGGGGGGSSSGGVGVCIPLRIPI
jgi:hypothetical protein